LSIFQPNSDRIAPQPARSILDVAQCSQPEICIARGRCANRSASSGLQRNGARRNAAFARRAERQSCDTSFYTSSEDRVWISRHIRYLARYLVLALLLLVPLPNHARPEFIRLPFRTVHSMILVQGKVNGRPVTFLLDTGATRTIVSAKTYGNVGYRLRLAQRAGQQPGLVGESIALNVNLELADHTWLARRVSIMNFEGLSSVLGADFDGLLGEDVLREFRSVHIDYRSHTIELEQ
jgi:hypothetical protein